MSTQQVSSPDGRTWTITSGRSKTNLQDTRNEPLFWAHLVLTVGVVILLIFLLRVSWGPILEIWIPIATLIVVLGALGTSFRPQINAETPGPPKDHRKWTLTKRLQGKRCAQEVVAAIKAGNLTAEPEGTRLEEI